MTRIKICGITNADDAQAAVDAGANALGFIRVPGGPRFVPEATLVRIAYSALPPFVTPVFVVRNAREAADYPPGGLIQFYEGDVTEPVCAAPDPETALPPALAGRSIRAFRIRDADSLREIADYPHKHRVAAYLLDTFHDTKLGGGGQTFDWDLAVEARRLAGDVPLILSGGLTPENVGEAVARVRPFAVDVSSGVEAEPGRKDHDKIRAFVQAVRDADATETATP